MIQWLHISDLHFKSKAMQDADQSNFCNVLLKECREGELQADFVVATGDFHNFWDTKEYDKAKMFLCDLACALNLELTEDFFLVPGNHDENDESLLNKRKIIIEDFVEKERKVLAGKIKSSYALTEDCQTISTLLTAFQDYSSMVKDTIPDIYSNKAYQPEEVHVRTWKNQINILHLNTALISDNNRDHSQIVDINTACGDSIWENVDPKLPTIVLGHHSFFDLNIEQRQRLIQMFNQRNVWAYLAGDQHRANFNDDHDYYINRKQDRQKTWPNIVADKLAASTDDNYSEFGVVHYTWDEHSEFEVYNLRWNREGSGIQLIKCSESVRHFPMKTFVTSKLYFELITQLQKTRREHPSFQLMEIDSELYPKALQELNMISQGVIENSKNPLPLNSIFNESWSSEIQNHLLMEGEGGIGKTVALLSLVTTDGILPHDVPAVYVPIQDLKASKKYNSIDKYLLEQILSNNKGWFKELKDLSNQCWESGPRLVMLLDGFNEVSQEDIQSIASDIEEWSKKKGIQIVVSSRFDVSSYLRIVNVKSIHLCEVSLDIVREYLVKNELEVPFEGSSVWNVINYPLMLALYVQTQGIKEKCSSVIPLKWKVASNAGAIIWNYLQKELYRCWRNRDNASVCVFAMEYIAPYIAWKMLENQMFSLKKGEMKVYIHQALQIWTYLDELQRPDHIQNVWDENGSVSPLPEISELYSILTKKLNIFRISRNEKEEATFKLMHQRFRDCFAAIHLVNQCVVMENGKLPSIWKCPVDNYVMDFLAELLERDEVIPLLLWETNRNNPMGETSMRTMLELQSRLTGNDFRKLDFKDMDLRKINLYRYRDLKCGLIKMPEEKYLMQNTRLSKDTFEPEGHNGSVNTLAFVPGKGLIISGSDDKKIYVWDINTGQRVTVLQSHTEAVKAVVVSKDGKLCLSGSEDKDICVWNIETGKKLKTWKGHTSSVTALFITSNDEYCYSSSHDKTIRVWKIENGENRIICKCDSPINTMIVSKDNKKCIFGTDNGKVYVWDVELETYSHIWEQHRKSIRALALSPDNTLCFSSGDEKEIDIWDMRTGNHLDSLSGHTRTVYTLQISEDGNRCFSGSGDDTICVWNIKERTLENIWTGHYRSVYALTITSDGSRCFSGSWDASIRMWDVYSGKCLNVWSGFMGAVNSLAVSKDETLLFSGTDDGFVRIWNMNNMICKKVLWGHKKSVSCIALINGGTKCVSGARDCTIRVWDVETGKCDICWSEHMRPITSLAITVDGKTCFSSSYDGTVRKWDIKKNKSEYVWNIGTPVNCFVLSSDNKKGFVGLSNGIVKEWNIESDTYNDIGVGNTDVITALAVSKDATKLFCGASDNSIQIWDAESGKCKKVLKGHTNKIATLIISSDEKICISGSQDNTIRIWNIEEESCIYIGDEHTAWVNTLVLADKYSLCISGADDNRIVLWDLNTKKVQDSCQVMTEIYLEGVSISNTNVEPFEYRKVLIQNGAVDDGMRQSF